MEDREFIDYVEHHMRTPRKAFTKAQVDRLFGLAGLPPMRHPDPHHVIADDAIITLREELAEELIYKARERITRVPLAAAGGGSHGESQEEAT